MSVTNSGKAAAGKPAGRRLTIVALLLAALGPACLAEQARKPNLVILLADDLGIECLSIYGGKSHDTPNLDRLAAEGMTFTHCFSHPYCSPSRASLLTGRYPFRHGMREVIYDVERHANTYLHTNEPSFARQLKLAGYSTAIAGKWQLSFLHQRNEIRDFGFDHYQCWQIFTPEGVRTRRFHHPHFIEDGLLIADRVDGRYGPDLNIEFLDKFIRTNAAKKQPFLAYYTCLLPHFPWVPTPDSEDQRDPIKDARKTADAGDPKFFPDMVRYLDKQVGQVMRTLDDLGVADDTVVMFLADNGTDQRIRNAWGDNKIIPGGKGTMTDRGTRVPLVVRWPGRIRNGSTCDALVDFSDLLPTLCELTAAPLPEAPIHGRSFAPHLLGKPGNAREWVHVQDKEQRSVRNREFMLNDRNELRPVVEIWQGHPKPVHGAETPEESAARKTLQSVFDELGNH